MLKSLHTVSSSLILSRCGGVTCAFDAKAVGLIVPFKGKHSGSSKPFFRFRDDVVLDDILSESSTFVVAITLSLLCLFV